MRYLFLLICCQYGFAQDTIIDHFSDNNFTSYLEWKGDTASFIVNEFQQLQLQAEPNISPQSLYTKSTLVNEGQWSFYCKMLFNPSGQNFTEFVLTNPDSLFGTSQKLSLELGKYQDKITVHTFNNGNSELLLESNETVFTESTNEIWCKVSHLESIWTIEYSTDSLNWNTLPPFTYLNQETSTFGIVCHYTSSRKDKFIFDDIIISGFPFIDTVQPIILSNNLIDSSTLRIEFSEPINPTSLTIPSDIFFEQSASTISNVQWLTNAILQLTFSPLDYNKIYRLHLKNIFDLNANTITDTTLTYTIQKTYPYDLELNEVMIDPSPSVYLPEVEYIEIKNSASYILDLHQCALQIGEKAYTLPHFKILPDSCVVIYPASAKALIDSTVKTLFLESSFSLPNTSGYIEILDSNLNTIHSIQYSDTWYNNSNKQDGGWSLEQKYSSYPCLQQINWQASLHTQGGSPGINQTISDTYSNLNHLQPSGFAYSDSILQLQFPFSIVEKDFINPLYYACELDIRSIHYLSPFQIEITFNQPMVNNIMYTLTISDLLQPCFYIEWENLYFGLTSKPKGNELKISEVLFNTDGDHSEFIEYKNTSLSNLDVYDLALSVEKDSIQTTFNCANQHHLIPPSYYLVLAKDLKQLFQYYTKHPNALYVEIDNWVSLDDKYGKIYLLDRGHQGIDSSCYDYTWHSAFLSNVENTSLEKIDLDYNVCKATSWASAAETVNFATPGYINSQHLEQIPQQDAMESFSPNNDGENDLWIYTMQYSNPENKIDAFVYDLQGFKQYTYSKGLLAGTSHTFIWDGKTDHGDLLPIGTYIMVIRNRSDNTIWKKAVSITN